MSSEDVPFEPAIVPTKRPGKAGGVRAKNRREKTAALCSAGLALFRRDGLDGVTVDEITKAAGVSKGTFYRYFSDKAALVASIFAPLRASVEEAMQRCRAALESAEGHEELEQAYGALAAELGGLLLGSAEVVELYLRESRGGDGEGARGAIHELREGIATAAIDLTRVAHARGLIRDLPPELTALMVIGGIETLLLRFFAGELELAPGDVVPALISMVLDGVRRR